jgi:predicted RNase H-like HicB family nuclease
MEYRVTLIESDEGFAVSCPALKGCHSQGVTKEDALDNIRDAIQEWLAAEALSMDLEETPEWYAEVIKQRQEQVENGAAVFEPLDEAIANLEREFTPLTLTLSPELQS